MMCSPPGTVPIPTLFRITAKGPIAGLLSVAIPVALGTGFEVGVLFESGFTKAISAATIVAIAAIDPTIIGDHFASRPCDAGSGGSGGSGVGGCASPPGLSIEL